MKPLRSFHSPAVWPPLPWVMVFFLIYGVFELSFAFIRAFAPGGAEAISDMPELVTLRIILLATAAVFYAVFRLARFHPACNPAYAVWLKLSPWTADRSLPGGPIHLVWQDLIVLGALTSIAALAAPGQMLQPLAVFGLAYLGGLTFLLVLTRTWNSCVIVGFLWPALLLPQAQGWPMLPLIAALIGVLWHGHRTALRAFPWNFLGRRPNRSGENSLWQTGIAIPGLAESLSERTNVGWPYQALSPNIGIRPIPAARSFALSLLAGWWTFCVIVRCECPAIPGFLLFLALAGAMARVAIYCGGYCGGVQPSFNVWGRFVSGRWVVPGFDQVWLAPLAAVLAAVVGGVLTRRSGSWHPVVESIFVALVIFLLLNGGPTLRRWLLTGQHRYRPPVGQAANKQRLRPV